MYKDLSLLYESMTSLELYHITPTSNIPQILKHGLIPSLGNRSSLMENENRIYMFGSMEDVENAVSNWLGDEFDEDVPLSLLKISLPPSWPLGKEAFEYTTSKPIPSNLITVLNKNYGY